MLYLSVIAISQVNYSWTNYYSYCCTLGFLSIDKALQRTPVGSTGLKNELLDDKALQRTPVGFTGLKNEFELLDDSWDKTPGLIWRGPEHPVQWMVSQSSSITLIVEVACFNYSYSGPKDDISYQFQISDY